MSFTPASTVVEHRRRQRYNQANGWQTVETYRGPQAQIEAKRDELIANGWDVDVDEGPVWQLEATIAAQPSGSGGGGGTTEQPVDTWEIDANKIEKDLLNSDIDAVFYLDPGDLCILRNLFDGKLDAENAIDNPTLFAFPDSGDPWLLVSLHLAGVKSVPISQPVLRHTKTVSRVYEIPASTTGVDEIWTTAALKRTEIIPPLIAGTLRASTERLRTSAEDDILMISAWWKQHPKITQAAGHRMQIVQEWEWGLWSKAEFTGRLHT